MADLKGGQLDAMTTLFERYQAPIYRYFVRLTYDNNLSQEFTQQVFIRVFEKRNSFSGDAGLFRPWIYRIAHNLWLDYLKVHAPKKKAMVEWNQEHDYPHDYDTTNFTDEDFQRLGRTLELLSEEPKQLLILSRYQGLKYGEIAQMMNTSEGAIKVRMHRALKTLREIYFDKANHK